MTLDLMSDSYFVQLDRYSNSNPYRKYSINRPHIPISAHSNRLKKSSSIALHQLFNNQKKSLTLDRMNYKLRIKSDLNVDTLRETHHHGHNPLNLLSRPATTKTFIRQPTAVTKTTNSMKTMLNDEIGGIEGNAVRVGTLNDLIKHFHHEQIRLIHHSTDYLDNTSSCTGTNRLINERTTSKTSTLPPERIIKQPQALTEYHFNAPNLPRTSSQVYRDRPKENRNNNTELSLFTDQYSLKLHSTPMTSHDKRIQESREKTLFHTEKQLCICNKLTIVDPYNSEPNQSTLPSTGYIFPPMRPFGYFTKKSIDDVPQSTPLPIKKRYETKKLILYSSLESIEQVSIDGEKSSPVLNGTDKSIITVTDLDDLNNPPNTRINVD